jgi:hypothetical protein
MQMNTKWWETAEPCEPVRLLGAQRRHGRTCWRLDPVANGRVGGDAVTLGCTYLLPPLSFGGASMVPPWLRFHIPLIGRVEGWRAPVWPRVPTHTTSRLADARREKS